MTPNDIETLIHYHCSPLEHPRLQAPAVKESIDGFIEAGILYIDKEGSYSTTERGKALIAVLCATPYPVQAWVDKAGDIVEI